MEINLQEYRIKEFHDLEPASACDRLGRLLRQRGAAIVKLPVPRGVMHEATDEIRRHRFGDDLLRTPRQVASAYFGAASAWTYRLTPPGSEPPQDEMALRCLDSAMEGLGATAAEAAQRHLQRLVKSRALGLLHLPAEDPDIDGMENEDDEQDDGPVNAEDDRRLTAEEAWSHLVHCGRRKVVLLLAFGPTVVQLDLRHKTPEPVQLEMRMGDVLIYLHDLCFLRVLQTGPLLQLDLKIEATREQQAAAEELLEVPQSLVQTYEKLLDQAKVMPVEELGLQTLRDAHLQSVRGIGIASLEVELPSLCLRGTSSVPLLASLLGGLDAAAPVVGPPRSVRQLQERQFYGAKWDLDEYFSADSGQDGSKIYCKHHSVLYRSCGVSDFDYRYFGIPAQDAREMDPRCRLLLEGHEAALRAAGQRSSQERSYGVFSGLSGLGSRAASNPSLIVGQVAEFLNLTGTTMNLDTGDASSLMAVERAVVSVRKGECVAALASSVHWITGPAEALAMCRQRLLAPSGRTRSFDASADGFLPGEGAVVCLLGSPSGTRAGGDRGSIVGVGSKFSGKAASLKAPHAPSVSEVLAKAARDGALPLATLDAVEASAGGQASSDAEELALLRRALRHRDESRPVVVSCIKASFGNAGVAGGLLGIARSLILLGRGLHGPQLHLHTLALEPPEDETGTRRSLHIPTEVLAGGRLASQIIGVSSFAATGYCAHHLVLAEPPVIPSKASQGQHPLWWPYKLMEKDRTLVYRGYFLQGTMTAWSEGLPMTRVNEEDELDTFEGYIGLESDFPETFQIWVDDDPDKALHPPQRGDPAEAAVIGPSSAAPRSLCWKIGEDGRAGDGYRIRLQVNGSLRRLSWKKMPKEARTSLAWTLRPHSFSLLGDHSSWTFEAMRAEPDGSFSAELQLLKALSNFQIFRDEDFEQGVYPAHEAMQRVAGMAAADAGKVEMSGKDVLGPDPHGDGLNFQVAGEVGALFRLSLRMMPEVSVAWEKVGWRAVDFKEVTKSHVYYVAGSWDKFASCQAMERDSCGSWSLEVTMQNRIETFQILLNRNWLATVHPDVSRAALDDDFRIEGPDEAGHGKYFCLGGSDSDRFDPGSLAVIHMEIEQGFPCRVWWERSNSDRAHELRIAAGLGTFPERHFRLLGLIPYDEETDTSGYVANPPDWWNEGRVEHDFIEERQESLKKAARQVAEARDTPENELMEKRKQLSLSLA